MDSPLLDEGRGTKDGDTDCLADFAQRAKHHAAVAAHHFAQRKHHAREAGTSLKCIPPRRRASSAWL